MPNSLPPLATQDERTLAMLGHVLQILTGFLGPLIIALVKRNSRFVVFHCLQAILWQAAYMVVSILVMVMFFASMLAGVSSQGAAREAPVWLVVAVPGMLVVSLGGWGLTLVLAIVYAVRAGSGQWAEYPLVGRWAKRLAGLEPG
ncbi:MAG: DUF4870 domain-containing protein [Terriglobales bacterium]